MPFMNRVIVATAGGRKTSQIVAEALATKERVLLTTYTRENTENIQEKIVSARGFKPRNVTVLTWMAFLFSECVRPYQNYLFGDRKIQGMSFVDPPRQIFKRTDPRYFLTRGNDIYAQRLSDISVLINEASEGRLISRLEAIYDQIVVDEMQDLAGWDLDLCEILFNSAIKVTLVGDPRQATFETTREPKNRGKSGNNIGRWLNEIAKQRDILLEERVENFRCNQEICDFADRLYPQFQPAKSMNGERTGHDGIFQITSKEAVEYFKLITLKF
jgi:DNA helicase-2/ATP-dependent DNA helicase PcrA